MLLRKMGFSERVSGRYFQNEENPLEWSFSSHRNRLEDRNYNNFYLETPTQHYLSAPLVGEAFSWLMEKGFIIAMTKGGEMWIAKCCFPDDDYKTVYGVSWEDCANNAIQCICETFLNL